MSYFSDIYKGVKSLLIGMSVTGKYFLTSRKGAITQQYPDNRETLKMFDRFRGEVIMPHDENNEHRCTGVKNVKLLVLMVLLRLFGTEKSMKKQVKRKK